MLTQPVQSHPRFLTASFGHRNQIAFWRSLDQAVLVCNPTALLPFAHDNLIRKFSGLANTILPGSKRLITVDGFWFCDNTDVRASDPNGFPGGEYGSNGGHRETPLDAVKLTIDGVFFVDGGFAGPNRLGSWEATVFAAEAHLACASLARENVAHPEKFFERVSERTGQKEEEGHPPPWHPSFRETGPPDPGPIRIAEQRAVGWRLFDMRMHLGDQETIATASTWADAPVPQFHKL